MKAMKEERTYFVVGDWDKNDSYPLEIFDEKAVTFLQCPICLNVPNPERAIDHLACGKLFCKACVASWSAKKMVCPACNQQVANPKTQLRLVKEHNKTVYQMMTSLRVRCPTILDQHGHSASEKCPFNGELSLLPGHFKDCSFLVVSCQWGCPLVFPRRLQQQHEVQDCPMRPVLCEFCKQKVRLSQLDSHKKQDCPQNPEALIPCRFVSLGCKYAGKRSVMPEHEKQEVHSHLDLAMQCIVQLREDVGEKDMLIARLTSEQGKGKGKGEKEKNRLAQSVMPNMAKPAEDVKVRTSILKVNNYFKTCPKNHTLVGLRGKKEIVCCACEKRYSSGSNLWGCEECGFYICARCACLKITNGDIEVMYESCPQCTNETRVLVKVTSSGRGTFTCGSCQQQCSLANKRYKCVYCQFMICSDCQLLILEDVLE